MLNILHKKINNIIPIISIEHISNNSYHIIYEDESLLNNNIITQIENIIQTWPVDQHRINILNNLNSNWNNKINDGWLTPYGWKLGLNNSDITLLSGAFLLAKEASSLGLSQDATIVDTDGISHTISITDFTNLMLQYGEYRSQISTTYSNLLTTINNASSIEQLNNININI